MFFLESLLFKFFQTVRLFSTRLVFTKKRFVLIKIFRRLVRSLSKRTLFHQQSHYVFLKIEQTCLCFQRQCLILNNQQISNKEEHWRETLYFSSILLLL